MNIIRKYARPAVSHAVRGRNVGGDKKRPRPKSDDQLTISLIWEYSFQLMPIRKLKKDETGDVIILLS